MSRRRSVLTVVVIALAATAGAIAFAYNYGQATVVRCAKPQNGFLIIEGSNGYNDSLDHSPGAPWPVINVSQGQTVSIVICNTDVQSHELEIQHYYNSTTVQMPNHAVLVSFVANQTGTFRIYNSNFDSLQISEQNGELIVTR